jgi:hypothetical protein
MRRPLGVGMLLVAAVLAIFVALTVFGYMLAESEDLPQLLLSVVVLGGIAAVLVFVGLRFLSEPG